MTGREALEHGADGLATFGRAVLSRIAVDVAVAQEESERRLDRREQQDAELSIEVYSELADIVRDRGAQPVATSGGDPLLAACRLVGTAAGFEVTKPARGAVLAAREPLAAIAQASDLRTRDVALETDWWRRDSGPLVATVEVDGRPVALLPRGPGRYDLVDPEIGERVRVDSAVAATLARQAHAFYRPLPARPLRGREMERFVLRDGRRDAVRLLVLGFAAGLLSLLPPIVAAVLFEEVVPAGQLGRLVGLSLLLVAAALAAGTFGSFRGSPLCGSRDASRRRCRRRSGTACSVSPSPSSAATRRAT